MSCVCRCVPVNWDRCAICKRRSSIGQRLRDVLRQSKVGGLRAVGLGLLWRLWERRQLPHTRRLAALQKQRSCPLGPCCAQTE